METRRALLNRAIEEMSALPFLSMDAASLAEDVMCVALAFPEERDFLTAITNTVKALRLIAEDKVRPAGLKWDFSGWLCFHYRSSARLQGAVDMRIVYKKVDNEVLVMGFGHRFSPKDLYQRMREG